MMINLKKNKDKLTLVLVSLILASLLGLAFRYSEDIDLLLSGDNKKEYCLKAKQCIMPDLNIERCKFRVKTLINLGVVTEEDFLLCTNCINDKACSELRMGVCADECDKDKDI